MIKVARVGSEAGVLDSDIDSALSYIKINSTGLL